MVTVKSKLIKFIDFTKNRLNNEFNKKMIKYFKIIYIGLILKQC